MGAAERPAKGSGTEFAGPGEHRKKGQRPSSGESESRGAAAEAGGWKLCAKSISFGTCAAESEEKCRSQRGIHPSDLSEQSLQGARTGEIKSQRATSGTEERSLEAPVNRGRQLAHLTSTSRM